MFDLSGKPKRRRIKDPVGLDKFEPPLSLFPPTSKKKKRTYIPRDYEIKLLERQDEKCAKCGKKLRPKRYHLDHKVAIELGGSNSLRNLQLLCPECHDIKTKEDRRKMAAKKKRAKRKTTFQPPFKL